MFDTTLIAAFDLMTLVPFAVFGAIAVFVWVALDVISAKKSRTEERLDEMRDPLSRVSKDGPAIASGDAMSKMIGSAAPALAKPLQPKNEKDLSKLKQKLLHAGFRREEAASIFLGLKIMAAIAGLVMGGGVVLISNGVNTSSLIRTLMCGGIMFYLPEVVLWFLGKKRKEAIFLGLPDALDLMVVCVEAGLGLDQALRKVAEETKESNRVISMEFSLCNMQLQMGRPRQEVLHELGKRTGVDDVKSLTQIIIQADKFGSSIAQALRVQSDAMRVKRRQIAEEKAAKTAVQLIFPLVLFIFPGIFVVLVGPAAITMVNEMLPAFQNR